MSSETKQILTTDGIPLEVSLKKAEKKNKIKAFLLVAPLLLFLIITYIFPIGEMFTRSIDDKMITNMLPKTFKEMESWDGQELPPEEVFSLGYGFTHPKSVSYSKEDIEELRLSLNQSLTVIIQQSKERDEQNHVLIQQLQNKISNNEKRLNSSQSTQLSMANSHSDQLSKLQKHVDGLEAEIHRPVNLYKDCKEDTVQCSIDPSQSRDYWRDCATLYLPLDKEVCYLTDCTLNSCMVNYFKYNTGMGNYTLSVQVQFIIDREHGSLNPI